MTISNTVRPMPMSAAPSQAPAPEIVSVDSAAVTEDLLKLNDPEYNKVCRELADLKRVQKGLKNPGQMDPDIYQRFENLSKEKTKEKCDKIANIGTWTLLGSFFPIMGVLMAFGPVACIAVAVPGITVGGLLHYDLYKKMAGPRLQKENMDNLINEARRTIDSNVSGSEAKLSEIRKKAVANVIEKAKKDRESGIGAAVRLDALQDEDDCIVIGGIKLKKHADAAEDQKGGILHFLKNSLYHRG